MTAGTKRFLLFALTVAAFLLILAAGIFLISRVGVYIPAATENPSCPSNLQTLNDKSQIDIAESRCSAAYNNKTMNSLMNYQSWSLSHRSTAMIVQMYSTVLLLSVVIFIIFFGLAVSYQEFRKGKETSTTLKLGGANLEVSSTLMGIVILSISLGFAYIYFDKAYKISEIATAGTKVEAPKADAAGKK